MHVKHVKELKLPCTCGGHHSLEFSKWDDEKDYWCCLVSADNHCHLWGRIKEAVRHIFKDDVAYHDVVLRDKDMKKIENFLKLNKQT